MTHVDPRAVWGAVAINQGISHLLPGNGSQGLIEAAVHDFQDGRVVEAITRAPGIKRNDVVSGGYVLDTLNAAFWSLLTTDSAEDAIVHAVSLGSDADTTGAFTGALAGALYGASTLPAHWLDALHNAAEIRELEVRLVGWDT